MCEAVPRVRLGTVVEALFKGNQWLIVNNKALNKALFLAGVR